jgi:small ligand-binding sensory domain FIST
MDLNSVKWVLVIFKIPVFFLMDGTRQDEESLENAELNFFRLDAETCKQHLDWTLQWLKEHTLNERILGAVMFTTRRGPTFMGEQMSDATQFQKHFPTIPCCGFYSGGTIGPLALAGHKNVKQKTGKTDMQSTKAVYTMFFSCSWTKILWPGW